MKRVPASAADLPALPSPDRMTLDRQAYRVVREALMSGRQPVGAALTRLAANAGALARWLMPLARKALPDATVA